LRTGKEKGPEIAIRGTHEKLEMPAYDEGFDKLFYVEIINNKFIIKDCIFTLDIKLRK
jgi:hypothetical protein